MPKRVDHEEKRDSIGRAVWAVLNDDGLLGLSVRSVAERAGIPPSTLQYFFATREDLISHALQLAIKEQQVRIDTEGPTGTLGEQVEEALCSVLPFDDARRVEAHVWFSALVGLRGALHRKVLDDAEDGLDHLARWSVEVITGRDRPGEAVRLRAFIDGLALNALSRPVLFSPPALREHVQLYLRDLGARHPLTARADRLADNESEKGSS
ncbi:TetR/AcrR family transcriptional regulator [Clavibacter sp. Sh2088]|uniref:TetR/AcrR family transcriptional regulator n=1 Tax=Clavibacter sp. Sh2088 TaxID=3397676 RepID=UPI0039E1F0F9